MSLHPLNPEMLTVELLLATGGVVGGVELWQRGHPLLAGGGFGLAGLVVLAVAGTALAEREHLEGRQLLRSLLVSLLLALGVVGYLAGVGAGLHALWLREHPWLALGAGLAGCWLVPVALVAALATLAGRRQG